MEGAAGPGLSPSPWNLPPISSRSQWSGSEEHGTWQSWSKSQVWGSQAAQPGGASLLRGGMAKKWAQRPGVSLNMLTD